MRPDRGKRSCGLGWRVEEILWAGVDSPYCRESSRSQVVLLKKSAVGRVNPGQEHPTYVFLPSFSQAAPVFLRQFPSPIFGLEKGESALASAFISLLSVCNLL